MHGTCDAGVFCLCNSCITNTQASSVFVCMCAEAGSLPLHKFKLIQFESVCNPYNSIMTCAHNLRCLSRLFIVAPLLLFFLLFYVASTYKTNSYTVLYNWIQAKWQTQTEKHQKTIHILSGSQFRIQDTRESTSRQNSWNWLLFAVVQTPENNINTHRA